MDELLERRPLTVRSAGSAGLVVRAEGDQDERWLKGGQRRLEPRAVSPATDRRPDDAAASVAPDAGLLRQLPQVRVEPDGHRVADDEEPGAGRYLRPPRRCPREADATGDQQAAKKPASIH